MRVNAEFTRAWKRDEGGKMKRGQFALARFWLELAEEARVEADHLPEGGVKDARLRVIAQYEQRARVAVQTDDPSREE